MLLSHRSAMHYLSDAHVRQPPALRALAPAGTTAAPSPTRSVATCRRIAPRSCRVRGRPRPLPTSDDRNCRPAENAHAV